MFEKLTRFTEKFAYHRHASFWLFFYAVIESVVFPVPPDVLLIALTLGRPKRGQGFAVIAAAGSVAGGFIGYLLGRYAFDPIVAPILEWFCSSTASLCPNAFVPRLENLFEEHGFWIVAISAFSPIIPYRLTILVAGMAHMALMPFLVVSFFVHWLRYAIVCGLVRRYGQKAIEMIQKRLSWIFIVGGAAALAIYVAVNYF